MHNSFSAKFSVLFSLGFFLVSALIGTLISYAPSVAWVRLGFITSGIAVLVLFARMPERILRTVFVWLPTVVLICFFLTNDWTARIGKLVWFDPVLRWLASWQPSLPGLTFNSNSLGGVLGALVPLQMAALLAHRADRQIEKAIPLIGFTALGLLLSESRSVWLALGIVAWMFVVWKVSGGIVVQFRTRIAIWITAVVLLIIVSASALTLTPLGGLLLARFRSSVDLVSDYSFTGLGLGGFTMAYSSYVLLVHVPHTSYANNLLLDIWLEQGLLGLAAFAAIILTSVLNARDSRWRLAAFASVAVILLHGIPDDAFYGYGGNAIPLLFVPFGVLLRQTAATVPRQARNWLTPIFAGVVLVAVGVVWAIPAGRAAWFANLGALAQTRAELPVYHWPEWGFQDELRRSGLVDLRPAIELYKQALEIDPTNATANRRLGQIEFAQEHYSVACDHIRMAYAIAPYQRATRQFLGECFAIVGEIDRAVELWRSIDLEQGQLTVRWASYASIHDKERAARIEQAARLLSE